MNKTALKIAISAGSAMPLFAFAQTTVSSILVTVENILNAIIPILIVVATIVFLWGIIMYITAAGDEKKSATAKSYITSGLIGLFFMVAIWGIIRAIVSTLDLDTTPLDVNFFGDIGQ